MKLLYALLIILSLITFSCKNYKITEGPAAPVQINLPIKMLRVDSVGILDRSLQDWYYYKDGLTGIEEYGERGKIAVEILAARRKSSGVINVNVTFRNRTDYQQQIEVRTHFYDNQMFEAEDPSAWQRLILYPNAIATYKEFSVSRNVEHYYVEVREGL